MRLVVRFQINVADETIPSPRLVRFARRGCTAQNKQRRQCWGQASALHMTHGDSEAAHKPSSEKITSIKSAP